MALETPFLRPWSSSPRRGLENVQHLIDGARDSLCDGCGRRRRRVDRRRFAADGSSSTSVGRLAVQLRGYLFRDR
ncbi:uncharacterized protein DS421_9g263840 [Arachis hypogaea]|nr:uncharacterized protein DS421_9g263840 [Arachis hypogaea]